MRDIDDAKSLCALSIPGTHDSGATAMNCVPAGWARCQNHNISIQLGDGIRFLDIRLKKVAGQLDVYHGAESCHQSFEDVLGVCTDFLTRCPTETILMLVNAADSTNPGDFADEFAVFSKSAVFLKTKRIPALGEARGKIVFLRRFQNYTGFGGIDFSKGWPNNAVGTFTTFDGDTVHIEDCFTGDYHDTHKKWDIVKEHLDLARHAESSDLYITYNSIAGGWHTPYQYAWGPKEKLVDPIMNQTLISYIKDSTNTRWGIVPVDYYKNEEGNIDERIIRHLVASNFG